MFEFTKGEWISIILGAVSLLIAIVYSIIKPFWNKLSLKKATKFFTLLVLKVFESEKEEIFKIIKKIENNEIPRCTPDSVHEYACNNGLSKFEEMLEEISTLSENIYAKINAKSNTIANIDYYNRKIIASDMNSVCGKTLNTNNIIGYIKSKYEDISNNYWKLSDLDMTLGLFAELSNWEQDPILIYLINYKTCIWIIELANDYILNAERFKQML